RSKIPSCELLNQIELLVLDFDGVMTDNRVWVNEKGEEAVYCNRFDSWGLNRLKKEGIKIAVVSTESNPVVVARCKKLNIPCISSSENKVKSLIELTDAMNIDRFRVAFVGNDTNDSDALSWVGLPIIVSDAEPYLRSIAVWITRNRGGEGAVREICDALIQARNAALTASIEGENIYFVRRDLDKRPDFEDAYWGIVRDPDGNERERSTERDGYLENIQAELHFLNNLPGGRLLDVGCGLGFLLSEMKEVWKCHGVEVSQLAAESANKWGQIINGTIEDAAYPPEYFDAVVFYHVIEHLGNPVESLREIRRVMQPGAWLLLGTPDFDSGCARRFRQRYRLLHDQTHINLFSSESVYRLLRAEGFIVDHVDYPFFSTSYFTRKNLHRLFDKENVSPPFYGNFMTFYARKPRDDEPLRPSRIKLKYEP
ncbi:methyltransferase domain-containing protein, partial [bacterium]|nr:methyltransferase domain-containing protein [bacterium]